VEGGRKNYSHIELLNANRYDYDEVYPYYESGRKKKKGTRSEWDDRNS